MLRKLKINLNYSAKCNYDEYLSSVVREKELLVNPFLGTNSQSLKPKLVKLDYSIGTSLTRNPGLKKRNSWWVLMTTDVILPEFKTSRRSTKDWSPNLLATSQLFRLYSVYRIITALLLRLYVGRHQQ